MRIEVFVENERGSRTKHLHDERRLVLRGTTEVSRPYPYPYGFVPGTDAADGCCVDCFVITEQSLRTGDRVVCVVVALLEQFENGVPDHNVIAVPLGHAIEAPADLEAQLREFIAHVFDHVPDKEIEVGRLRDGDAAVAHLQAHGASFGGDR